MELNQLPIASLPLHPITKQQKRLFHCQSLSPENAAQFLTDLGSITWLAMNKYLILVRGKDTGPKWELIMVKRSRCSTPVLDVVSRMDGSVTFCSANNMC